MTVLQETMFLRRFFLNAHYQFSYAQMKLTASLLISATALRSLA
jgi:hypothetical protein